MVTLQLQRRGLGWEEAVRPGSTSSLERGRMIRENGANGTLYVFRDSVDDRLDRGLAKQYTLSCGELVEPYCLVQ